ncbi:hypothetical protein PVAND_012543 [Polypedilum vanderplanki]|uniref:Rhodanese domain-containing protein n=1 Tax=Polypedilum vanderplanki TaxID=319348 RepID=A0A9J6CNP6_POLVA|nr:hypothetical protein PVAND_012543 [Polypedilum vanderplanki]
MKFFTTIFVFLVGAVLINKIQMSEIEIATYEEIKDLPNHPEKLLIDVREPHELESTGKIPTSINIPLSKVKDALSNLDENDFKNTYGRTKPTKEDEIIFSCLLGGRAQKGAEAAVDLGYKNVKNYKGSWTEYAQKEGLKVE